MRSNAKRRSKQNMCLKWIVAVYKQISYTCESAEVHATSQTTGIVKNAATEENEKKSYKNYKLNFLLFLKKSLPRRLESLRTLPQKRMKRLEDLTVLKRSPDLLNNVRIGQDQLRLIMKHILFYGGYGHFG